MRDIQYLSSEIPPFSTILSEASENLIPDKLLFHLSGLKTNAQIIMQKFFSVGA